MNAPYGVMRCTVPSMTAPTSRSAMSSSFTTWSEANPHPGSHRTVGPAVRELSHRHQAPSIFRNRVCRTGSVERPGPLARGRLRAPALGDHDERDLAGLHHAQALPRQALQVLGIVELPDALLDPQVAGLEHLRLPGEPADLGPL